MRDTSDAGSAITTGIAANTITAAAAVLATDLGSTTPEREGLAATTLLSPPLAMARYKVGLQSSRIGVGEMLSPINIQSLSKKYKLVTLQKTQQ